MKTINRTQPFLYEVFTNKTDPSVPPGKIHIRMVTFETIELDGTAEQPDAKDEITQFAVLNHNCKEVRALKELGHWPSKLLVYIWKKINSGSAPAQDILSEMVRRGEKHKLQ